MNTTVQQDSRFLSLPAELRNQIYREVLHFKDPIPMIGCTLYQHAALLRVSSQTREEAASIFWGENRFYHILKGNLHNGPRFFRKYCVMIPEMITGYENDDKARQPLEKNVTVRR